MPRSCPASQRSLGRAWKPFWGWRRNEREAVEERRGTGGGGGAVFPLHQPHRDGGGTGRADPQRRGGAYPVPGIRGAPHGLGTLRVPGDLPGHLGELLRSPAPPGIPRRSRPGPGSDAGLEPAGAAQPKGRAGPDLHPAERAGTGRRGGGAPEPEPEPAAGAGRASSREERCWSAASGSRGTGGWSAGRWPGPCGTPASPSSGDSWGTTIPG